MGTKYDLDYEKQYYYCKHFDITTRSFQVQVFADASKRVDNELGRQRFLHVGQIAGDHLQQLLPGSSVWEMG